VKNSEQLAVTPLLPLGRHHTPTPTATSPTTIPQRRFRFRAVVLTPYRDIDRRLEDFVHAAHFLGRALHVQGAHFLRDGFPLGLRDWGQALGFEELDAVAFVAEVGFEGAEDYWGCGAEVEDFGVPLTGVLARGCMREGVVMWVLPCRGRFRGSSGSRWRSRRRGGRFQGRRGAVSGRILPALRYPTVLAPRPFRTACARLV